MNAIVLLDDNNRIRSVLNPAPFSTGIPLQVSFVTLTDAQIKAGEPLEVLPPTEVFDYDRLPSQLPVIVFSVATLNCESGAYDNAVVFSLGYGITGTRDVSITTTSSFPASATKQIAISTISYSNSGIMNVGDLGSNGIVIFPGGGDGGQSSNTLKVTIYYNMVNVS